MAFPVFEIDVIQELASSVDKHFISPGLCLYKPTGGGDGEQVKKKIFSVNMKQTRFNS